MSTYMQPIFTASLVFGGLAFLLFVPWLIYTYRKFGYLSVSTTLVVFSFIFYFLSALFLVLLPLPSTRDTCSLQPPGMQYYSLVPFQFVKDTLRNSGIVLSQPATYIYALKQPAFQQAFFNFLLLLPFGVYLRYFFQKKKLWPRALLLTFCLTLFYEITQVTGIYGIYNCPYRIFDVDDLMLNTAGGVFGFFAAPVILALFPSRSKVSAKAEQLFKQDEVKPMAILLALLVDYIVLQILATGSLLFVPNEGSANFITKSTLILFIFCIVPALWNGQTLGTKLLKFRYDSKISNAETFKRLLKRTLALYSLYVVPVVLQLITKLEFSINSPYYSLTVWSSLIIFLAYCLAFIILLVHIIIVFASKGQRRFFFDEAADLTATRLMPDR